MILWLARLRHTVLVAVVLIAVSPAVASALDVPPAPTDIPVVDQTNTLSSEQKQALAAKIAKERSESGNQVAILIIKSLEGDAIENYSYRYLFLY